MEQFEKEFYKRLLKKAEIMLKELTLIDIENKEYLNQATKLGNIPLEEVEKRMKFAEENNKNLKDIEAMYDSLAEKLK